MREGLALRGDGSATAKVNSSVLPLASATIMVYSTRHDKNADRQIPDRTDVRHRVFSFRGVIFDIDPEFNNTEEWWLSIPEEVRPHKDQPFYHLLAENSESEYVAYVPSRICCLTNRANRSGIRRSRRFS